MADGFLGTDLVSPSFQFQSIISPSWIWIFFIFLIGIFLIVGLCIFLFFKTYNIKIEFYENISGRGFQRVAVRRARKLSLGMNKGEVLKPLGVDFYLTAYGKRIQKNTYMFVKGGDGFWYNSEHGDFDAKTGILDIEPVDRDVKYFSVAMDRLTQNMFGEKPTFLQKYGGHLFLLLFAIIMIIGFWFLVGKIGDAVKPLGQSNENQQLISQTQLEITNKLNNLLNSLHINQDSVSVSSGVIPANETGGG